MKSQHFLLLLTVSMASAVTSHAAGTICAGAATLNNGSVVIIGQPFVGVMSAPDGSVTLNAGIVPVIKSDSSALPAPTTISPGAQMRNNVFEFSFLTQVGRNYVVEASTNLIFWTAIWTNFGTGTDLLFQDADAVLYPRRFYRLLSE